MAEPVTCDRRDAGEKQPILAIESGPHGRGWCVTARNLGPDLVASLGGIAGSFLHVKVAEAGDPHDDHPDISGDYDILSDGVRFVPRFTFDSGVRFRATLEMRAPGHPESAEVVTLEFLFPSETAAAATKVSHVFPSSDVLPENLLRFFIRFSNPMQRGRAFANIDIRGPDGRPVTDVLYRPPVELWDRSMTCLTVLLDPGRLKRGVGPNRTLGPPLEAGQRYTLAIGTGMIDLYGRPLYEAFHKSFSVSHAIRTPIAIGEWTISPPAPGTHQSLELRFPRPLNWAQLWHAINIASTAGRLISGRIDIDGGETRWRFTPDEPWQAGAYSLRVAPELEDICGNTPGWPFDGPSRSTEEVAIEADTRLIPFVVKTA